jgi:hypothetical protein
LLPLGFAIDGSFSLSRKTIEKQQIAAKSGRIFQYIGNFLVLRPTSTLAQYPSKERTRERFVMGQRYWVWVIVRLAVGVAIVAWAASYLGTGSAEKEFQKTLDAMKQVHSFRVASSASEAGIQHNENLWEVDCNRDLAHHQMHVVQTASNVNTAQEFTRDEVWAGGLEYDRQNDGSWSKGQYSHWGDQGKFSCGKLAEGDDSNLLPQIATMIKRGILQKGDKKTVNGIRCREWLVTMKGGPRGLEHDSICLGLADHLPYEMTVDWENSRASFSDYNAALQIEVPEVAVQSSSSSATDESN